MRTCIGRICLAATDFEQSCSHRKSETLPNFSELDKLKKTVKTVIFVVQIKSCSANKLLKYYIESKNHRSE